MTFYAWTIAKPGRQSVKKVGDGDEMLDNLRTLNSGYTPTGFVRLNAKMPDYGTYTHCDGGIDEWSVRWTKIDG